MSLRIGSDDLVPDEITRLLGATPTHAQTKGEKIVGKKTSHVRIAKFGMWRLSASAREPEDMDGQIREILSQTTSDLSVWRGIAQKHKIDLFWGLFLRVSNEGMSLSPESLAALAERGIELALDIYSGHDEDESRTFSIERIAAGGAPFPIRVVDGRRHRSPRRWTDTERHSKCLRVS